MADLVGNTPRAVKRFVNIYLLAKSIGVNRGFRLPPNGQLALLLAISVSGAAARIFSELTKTPLPNNTLGAVLSGIPLPLSFKTWVDMHPDCRNLDMSGLADWVHLISRFRFSGG